METCPACHKTELSIYRDCDASGSLTITACCNACSFTDSE